MATIIDSGKTFNNQKVGYSIEENGYGIYLDGKLWITQPDPYGKNFVPNGTYEENALAQIEELTTPVETPATDADVEQLRADIDFIAAMTGVELVQGGLSSWH